MSDSVRPEPTIEQIMRQESKRQVEAMARDLEQCAQRLRDIAGRFDRDKSQASSIAADAVQEAMGVGGIMGSRAWGLVRELGRLPDEPGSKKF